MKADSTDRLMKPQPWMGIIIIFFLTLLTILLLVEAGFSLAWPITHDEAPLLYEAFLMRAEGRLPYRDLFDFQMPGAYAIFYVIGLLTNFDPLRIRILDLICLSAVLSITYFMMKPFGWKPALAAAVLFGLEYMKGGPNLALQREYLLLIFLAFAVWIYHVREQSMLTRSKSMANHGSWFQENLNMIRLSLVGLGLGMAATIKPQAAIGLLPFLFFEITGGVRLPEKERLLRSAVLVTGFLVPIIIMTAWLVASSTAGPFLDIALNYWPLYSQISGQLLVVSGAEHWWLILDQVWRLGGNETWLLPAALGTYFILRRANIAGDQRRISKLLVWMAVCYSLYPALSGQFFQYHYLPFVYFIILLSSLCIAEIVDPGWRLGAAAVLLLAILGEVRPASALVQQFEGKPATTAEGREEKIAAYLASHLKPGDTVQPLDWTGGSLQAMLATRARLATSFVFDFYFYHHVTDPYIRDLRDRFFEELQTASPKYIVEVTAMDKPWVAGPDTSREFPELRAFLADNYVVDVHRDDYNIYKKR